MGDWKVCHEKSERRLPVSQRFLSDPRILHVSAVSFIMILASSTQFRSQHGQLEFVVQTTLEAPYHKVPCCKQNGKAPTLPPLPICPMPSLIFSLNHSEPMRVRLRELEERRSNAPRSLLEMTRCMSGSTNDTETKGVSVYLKLCECFCKAFECVCECLLPHILWYTLV